MAERLSEQLCFPLYACSKEIVRRYTPLLEPLDLTYTQYLVMKVLWEQETISARDLGTTLYLDSGTLTPVLKRLEQKGLLSRQTNGKDRRILDISITENGKLLQKKAEDPAARLATCIHLAPEESQALCQLLDKMLQCLTE